MLYLARRGGTTISTNFFWTPSGLALARTMVDDIRARRPVGDEAHIGKRWMAGWWCEECACWLGDALFCPGCAAPAPPWFAPKPSDTPVCCRCGFTWAQDPEVVGGICRQYGEQEIIVDEYDTLATGQDFLLMLERLVRRTVMDLIGVEGWC